MAITKPRKPRVVLPSNDAGFEANQYGVFSDIRNMVDDLGLMSDDLGAFAESINNYEVYATSTTSNTVSNGTKTFTVEASKGYLAGMVLAAVPNANPLVEIKGRVQSYNITTGALVLDSGSVGFGSGTYAAWKIYPTVLANTGDFQANKFTKVSTTGTGTAYVATLASNLVAMEDGIELDVTFHADCTAVSTLALNGFAPLNLVARNLTDGSVANLSAGAVTNGFTTKVRSQGSNWVCDEVLETTTFVELTANTTLTSANTLGKVLNLNFIKGIFKLPLLSSMANGQSINFTCSKTCIIKCQGTDKLFIAGTAYEVANVINNALQVYAGNTGEIFKRGNEFHVFLNKSPRVFAHTYSQNVTLDIGDTVFYRGVEFTSTLSVPLDLKIDTDGIYDPEIGGYAGGLPPLSYKIYGSVGSVSNLPSAASTVRLLVNNAAQTGVVNQQILATAGVISGGVVAITDEVLLNCGNNNAMNFEAIVSLTGTFSKSSGINSANARVFGETCSSIGCIRGSVLGSIRLVGTGQAISSLSVTRIA